MKSYPRITCSLLAVACSGLIQSCSQCDALTAAAVASGAIALVPGVDDKTRVAAGIATPILGYFAYNCYQASERQKREAEARAKQLQRNYVRKGGAAKKAQRYYAVPVSRDSSAERKFQVKEGVRTQDVIMVDAEKGTVMDPAVYEIDRAKKSLDANGKNVTVDV